MKFLFKYITGVSYCVHVCILVTKLSTFGFFCARLFVIQPVNYFVFVGGVGYNSGGALTSHNTLWRYTESTNTWLLQHGDIAGECVCMILVSGYKASEEHHLILLDN